MIRPRAGVAALGVALWSGMLAPPPVAALDLLEALRQAASTNPTLAARAAMVDAARRRVAPAGAWPQPMMELGAVNVPTSGRFDTDMMTMKTIGISQRVPVFGHNRIARRAADQGVAGAAAAAEETRFEILGMTWAAYADARAATERVHTAEAHDGVMGRLVESARVRFQSGTGRLEDVLRAQAEQARTIADLAAFRAEERGARARLDEMLGVLPGVESDTLAPLPESPPLAALETWLASAGPDHPRLRGMDAAVNRYRLSARAARRMTWPDLQLRASYGRRGRLVTGIDRDDVFSAWVGFTVPVFAGSRELSQGAEMDAMARASEAERRATELELRQEVTAAHAMAAAARRTVGLLADTVMTTQRRALEASWTSYRAGMADLWRVFESTHALYTEEIALTRARQDQARAEARLVFLTGRADLLGIALPDTGSE